jgi:hypothetical protein
MSMTWQAIPTRTYQPGHIAPRRHYELISTDEGYVCVSMTWWAISARLYRTTQSLPVINSRNEGYLCVVLTWQEMYDWPYRVVAPREKGVAKLRAHCPRGGASRELRRRPSL